MKTALIVGGIALVVFLVFKPGKASPGVSYGLPMYGGFTAEGKWLQ